MSARYLVTINGSGEYDSDFSAIVVEAESPESAVERLQAEGYGAKPGEGIAYVAPLEDVSIYALGETTRKIAERVTFDQIVKATAPTLRQYIDPDGGHPTGSAF